MNQDEAIQKVLDYLWDDEMSNWEEAGKPEGHIFNALKVLREGLAN